MGRVANSLLVLGEQQGGGVKGGGAAVIGEGGGATTTCEEGSSEGRRCEGVREDTVRRLELSSAASDFSVVSRGNGAESCVAKETTNRGDDADRPHNSNTAHSNCTSPTNDPRPSSSEDRTPDTQTSGLDEQPDVPAISIDMPAASLDSVVGEKRRKESKTGVQESALGVKHRSDTQPLKVTAAAAPKPHPPLKLRSTSQPAEFKVQDELDKSWYITFEQFVGKLQLEPELCQFFAEQNRMDLTETDVDCEAVSLTPYTRSALAHSSSREQL